MESSKKSRRENLIYEKDAVITMEEDANFSEEMDKLDIEACLESPNSEVEDLTIVSTTVTDSR